MVQKKLLVEKTTPKIYVHGSKLKNKVKSDKSLEELLPIYQQWKENSLEIEGRKETDLHKLTKLLNDYKNVVEPIFDSRPNSAQELLQPSIIEEFLEYVFCKLETSLSIPVPVREPASGYLELVFHPKNFESLVTTPEFTAHTKDHDFVIGGLIDITFKSVITKDGKTEQIVIPAVAFECKRYLERNMLDEIYGTAEMLKIATPYCRYSVVAEYLKMDKAFPELTKIDQIFILRKQKNSDRSAPDFIPNPISEQLVWDIYNETLQHLEKIWWDPESVLKTGKLFDR